MTTTRNAAKRQIRSKRGDWTYQIVLNGTPVGEPIHLWSEDNKTFVIKPKRKRGSYKRRDMRATE